MAYYQSEASPRDGKDMVRTGADLDLALQEELDLGAPDGARQLEVGGGMILKIRGLFILMGAYVVRVCDHHALQLEAGNLGLQAIEDHTVEEVEVIQQRLHHGQRD